MWLGPDEYLLIAPEAELEALQQDLQLALSHVAHSLVDVSHRQTALIMEGPGAEKALNAGIPLDLSLSAFPVDAVVRTILEKAAVVLWRQAPECFRLEVWRSFAPYVQGLLELAWDDNEF